VALEGKNRIYRRLEAGVGAVPVEFPVAFKAKPTGHAESSAHEEVAYPPVNLPTLFNHLLVQHFAPSAVLTSDKGDILYVSGRTGKYLEPAVGKASMNLFAMARQGLRLELTSAFADALREDRIAVVRGINVGTNGGTQTIDLTVQRLAEPRELRGTMLVVFSDVGATHVPEPPPTGKLSTSRVTQLMRELQRAQDEIQTTREEMQTSQEELKSTNEELQSTNEELQSTNEELTTSKEEMQSMNEELQTVNHELHGKLDELSRSNNDMKNLLNSTDVATLFLDSDLFVRRFTTPIMNIIKLIPSDIGRPISDITRDIDYPELMDDAREVLRTLVFKEKLVPATHDRLFAVRIMPYRTLENMIDGVVITFTDAAMTKAMERTLRQQASELRQMAESLPHMVLGCRADGICDYVSPQWTDYTGIPAGELLGMGWFHAVAPDDRERVRSSWQAALGSATPFNAELRIGSKDGSFRWFKSRAVPIRDETGRVLKWYGTSLDIDDLKHAIERRNVAADKLQQVLQGISDPAFMLNADDAIIHHNDAAQRLLGRPSAEIIGKSLTAVLPDLDGDGFRKQRQRVVAQGQAATFDASLARDGHKSSYTVSLIPGAAGITVLFNAERVRPVREQDGELRGRKLE
jgi:two-component system CheB/CheR fusion protein